MPIKSENTEKNEDLQEVSGTIHTPPAADVSEKWSPRSLLDMCIPLIAEDSSLSLMLIQSEDFYAPHITDPLKKITPFIQLLPIELKCELIMFLPLQDWKSLWKVSHQWRQVVSTAAEIFLNQVERDKLPPIQFDFDEMLKNLLAGVNKYAHDLGRRVGQVQEVRKLAEEVGSFTYPLTKLIHSRKKIEEIQKNIEKEYSYTFFGGPRNSRLYQILGAFRKESQQVIDSPWFQKIKFCADLYPEHAVTKQLEDMSLEIKERKNKLEKKVKTSMPEGEHFSRFIVFVP